jgi:hypothetical protein
MVLFPKIDKIWKKNYKIYATADSSFLMDLLGKLQCFLVGKHCSYPTHYFNEKKLVSLLPISLKHSISLSLARPSFISSSLFKHLASVLDLFILFKHPALWYWCFPASLQPVMVFLWVWTGVENCVLRQPTDDPQNHVFWSLSATTHQRIGSPLFRRHWTADDGSVTPTEDWA